MTQSDQIPPSESLQFLSELAQAIQLREGAEGISKALWCLHRRQIESTRTWARQTHIPVPVLAALRRELEKRDIIKPAQKFKFTETGQIWMQKLFGQATLPNSQCPSCLGKGHILPPSVLPVLEKFEEFCNSRPQWDVTLDQSHATPETGVRKALFLLEKGLLGHALFFLGDDDGVSVACYLMRKHFIDPEYECGPISVCDIDPRYLKGISDISSGFINTYEYDVRNELPEELYESHQVALTDPAYTNNAITAFSFRCANALKPNGAFLLSIPISDSNTLWEIEINLLKIGFSIREIHPNFNEYHGASIHAHASSMIYGEKIRSSPDKSIQLRYTPFYTGDLKSTGGLYECTLCSTTFLVGPETEYITIQDLKQAGCDECGNSSFRKVKK